MHISLPDYSTLKDANQSSYIAYHVHINGLFHSRARYKHFHQLHEQLRKRFKKSVLPFFPRKKLFGLDELEIEQRRHQLETYLQQLCQQTELITSETLVDFFRSAQQDTLNAHQESITLKICLENGQFETIRVLSSDSLCRVKQKLCDQLRLPNNLNNLFDLFMIQSSVNIQNPQQASCGFFDELIVRKISDLESPYLTLCIANRGQTQFGLYWRRFYWNPEADEQLANNELTSKLVCAAIRRFFLQNESEISSDYLKHMDTLRLRPNKREKIRFYGYWAFDDCQVDHPLEQKQVQVLFGQREICFRLNRCYDDGDKRATAGRPFDLNECTFSINLIRCWRLTTVFKKKDTSAKFGNFSRLLSPPYEFAFEYLQRNGRLKWIAIKSHQAIVMASCLNKIVQELMDKRSTDPDGTTCEEIQFDLSRRICNYWKSTPNPKTQESLQLTKSRSIDTFCKPKTLLAETSFSFNNCIFDDIMPNKS